MNEENKMYEYLLEHNYISKNENKNPLRQQELSKERAECIANKYNNLVEELQNNWNELKKFVNRYYDYYMNEEDFIGGRLCFADIKNKMQEMENGNNVEDKL